MSEVTGQNKPGTGTVYMNRGNSNPGSTSTIDLAEVFGVLGHWIWLILLVALAAGTAAYAFSKFVLPEEFQSTTKIYVLDKSGAGGANSQTTYSDLQVGSQLTKDYVELIKSRTVLEAVMKDNHLENVYTFEKFADLVDVETPTDTRIVTITVTNHDPALAQKLADDIRIRSSELIINTMQIDAVNTYEEANYPDRKSGPSCSRWAIVAALIGALVVSAVVIVQYLVDDTIKSSDDIEKYLGLSNLALIPYDENVASNGDDARKSKHRFFSRRKADSREGRYSNSYQREQKYTGNYQGHRAQTTQTTGGAVSRSSLSTGSSARESDRPGMKAPQTQQSKRMTERRTEQSDRTGVSAKTFSETGDATGDASSDLTSELDAELIDQMLASKQTEHKREGRA